MDQPQQNHQDNVPQASAGFGTIRNDAEGFGKVPNGSETFRTVRKDAEGFRSIPKGSERKENHTLTVREVARLFESAAVARTERSIINWCQPNRQGISRLDGYFDPNERKYYITPESVELAVAEEKAKVAKINEPSEAIGSVPKSSERADGEADSDRTKDWESKVRDLEITNRAKDQFIEHLQKERNRFFDQLLTASQKVGELETKLLQLKSPDADAHV